MNRVLKVALATAIALVTLVTASLAAERMIIVMDGSGSMWGQIDGRPKLEIARDTVKDVLSRLPPDRELGLIAYGHREKGNCGDIELMVPAAKGTSGAVLEAVQSIRFLGKTPLTEAVRQAAEALRYTEEEATVVLVTDGLETCEADPCALGKELANAGLKFTAHVVGFGLSEEEGAAVACLAENTGGRYFDADDAGALADALNQVVLAEKAPPKPAAATSPKATISAPPTAAIASTIEAIWTGPQHAEDYLEIVPSSEKSASSGSRNYAYAAQGSPARLLVPAEAGDYLIRYIWSSPEGRTVLATAPLQVTDSEFAIAVPPDPIQMGSVASLAWKGPNGPGDYLAIFPVGNSDNGEISYSYVSAGSPLDILVPNVPGDYEISYIVEGSGERRSGITVPLKVIEGEVWLKAPASVRPGAAFSVNWRGPGNNVDYIDIVPDGHTETFGELTYAYVGGPEREPRELAAPEEPGTYAIRYLSEGAGGRRVLASTTLTVDPNAPEAAAQGLVEARFDVPPDFAGTPVTWSAVPLPGQPVAPEAWAMQEPVVGQVSATFEPGTYSVRGDAPEMVFAGEVTISPDGENTFMVLPDETLAPAPAQTEGDEPYESIGMGEDTGYFCEDPTPCRHSDAETGLSFLLPAGWHTDFPFVYETAGGARADGPTMSFFGPAKGDAIASVTLNPHQWLSSNGPCEDVAMGVLCRFETDDPDTLTAFEILRATLSLSPPG